MVKEHGDTETPFRIVLFDLDGTLVRGHAPIAGAPEVVAALRGRGMHVGFLTNNASRGAERVATLLNEGGFTVAAAEVCTSAQAAADLAAQTLPPGARVLVVGTEDLRAEVVAVGLTVVASADDGPAAVVQGFSPHLDWPSLAEACLAIRAGAQWVATNPDVTLPGARGLVPGNGAMVAALRAATGRRPTYAGKPEPALFQRAMRVAGRGPGVVVGDRLDTDIAGAARAGLSTVVVLSGVSRAIDVLSAVGAQRPQHIAADVNDLLCSMEELAVGPRDAWSVESAGDGGLLVRSATAHSGNDGAVDALRALCAFWWQVGQGTPSRVRAGDSVAEAALAGLGLADRGR